MDDSDNTLFDLIGKFAFVATFIIARFVVGSHFMYQMVLYSSSHYALFGIGLVYVISLLWVPTMVKFLVKSYRRYMKKEKKIV